MIGSWVGMDGGTRPRGGISFCGHWCVKQIACGLAGWCFCRVALGFCHLCLVTGSFFVGVLGQLGDISIDILWSIIGSIFPQKSGLVHMYVMWYVSLELPFSYLLGAVPLPTTQTCRLW
jgi:hypothetical protein